MFLRVDPYFEYLTKECQREKWRAKPRQDLEILCERGKKEICY